MVIGNGAYRDSPLLNPVNDAKAISAALRAAGFAVIERHDQGAVEMRRAIREFGERLRLGGAGLFYFAGHGVQVNGRNFLIPADADIKYEDEIEDQSVDVSLVLGKMESGKARINIVILDACRNNPFVRGSRSARSGLAAMEAPIGSLIAYATSPGQVASDGTGKNGLYTQHLLRELERPGLKVEDVFKRVRAAVRQASNGRQVPWENTSLEGDFYFRPPKDVEPGPSPQEIRRQQEAEIQRAVAEALTRSQDEADRERKRLEAAFAEKLERERAAIRKEALERIAAAERAAREAAVPPVPAGAPPPEPREGAPAPKTDASPPKAPLTAATDPAPAPAGANAVDSAVGSPETAAAPASEAPPVDAAPASEAPPDPVMVAMAAIGPDSKPRTVPDDVARGIVPPSRRVGDYWVFQRELRDGEGVARRNYVTLTVNAVRPDGFELEASDSAVPFRFDAAGNLYSMPAPRGGGTIVVDPVDPLFRYPLEAGASWSARTREILPGFAKDADSTVTVKGWEEVQVAAGTFRALKISKVAAMAWEPFPGRSMNSRRVSTVWFVPGVGHYARYEVLEVSTDGAVLLDQTWELDSFKLN
ncbi:MAG: caspase domain-containing protein [Burkholderiales bacterium]